MPTPRLPNEVLDRTLGYLPVSDLYTASRLSHTWQALAFPHLYNTVYLARATHLELFAKRVASDDGYGPLSVTKNLKGLTLDNKLEERYKDEAITRQIIDRLKAIIPRFHQLRRLCWDLPFTPDDKDLFPLFQTSCPKLESVDLSLHSTWLPSSSKLYTNLLNFSNLSQISFTVSYLMYASESCLEPLASLITSSPNLESISVNIYNWDSQHHTYSPTYLVSALGDEFTIPRLHTFRTRGAANPNWWDFFDEEEGESHPLRAFFVRHPGIEDLALGWSDPDLIMNIDEIEPGDLARLFPRLKHFEGPTYLCQPIVASSLASQLESLVVVDPIYDDTQTAWSTMDVAYGDVALPRLRRLAVWAESQDGIEIWPLIQLTKAATAFEDLEIRSTVTDYSEFLDLLRQLPNLRRLTLEESIVDTAADYFEDEDEDEDDEYEDEGEDDGDDEDEDDDEEDDDGDEEEEDDDKDKDDKDKNEDKIDYKNKDKGEKDNVELTEWERYLLKLAKICPRLEVVRNFVGNHKYQSWKIVRGVGKKVKVLRSIGDR